MSVLRVVFVFFRAFMVGQTALATENLALRQQMAVGAPHRAARYRSWLASTRISTLLALEVERQIGKAKDRRRDSQVDSPHVS